MCGGLFLCECHSIYILGVFSLLPNTTGIFKGVVLTLWIAFGSINILTMLISPVHEHKIPFHLFVSFFISLCLFVFTSLVKFIPKYFIVFEAIVKGSISFSLFQKMCC